MTGIKQYILFSEEELIDLGRGYCIDVYINGETFVCMSAEAYDEMYRENEEED